MKVWSVNRKIAVSHTDFADLFVWDFGQQQCSQFKSKTDPNLPNIVLQGHEDFSPTYALSWSNAGPIVASGNTGGEILIWNLHNCLS
mmetsp:Transcript_18334/g.28157  ORF Transcript_18334/g.28157 Transcript_18334/m.28157 type:complete len:87 (+) Transcript_18334:128-388(+)